MVDGNATPHRVATEHSPGYELGREVGRVQLLKDARRYIQDAQELYGGRDRRVIAMRDLYAFLVRNG